jgi:hypothetical protein
MQVKNIYTQKASQMFKVSRTTLRHQSEGRSMNAAFNKLSLVSRSVFSPMQEEIMKSNILKMQTSHYRLTANISRSLAFSAN